MALNPSYVIAPSLQEFFIDKDSGLPLSGGQVFFYVDNGVGSNIPKDVFELSGDPVFTYTPLPNPSTLSGVGTFQDGSGNDIIPYYYPFDDNGNIQLYYIEVYNSDGVLQFTRQGWPNFTTENLNTSEDVTNFIPNGQFLFYDNVPASASNTYKAGELSQDVTVIAPGGWEFVRGPSSTATDFITFPPFNAPIEVPTSNPLRALQVTTTVAGSDTAKDIRITFPNVNTFASPTQFYNFYFEGQSLTGGNVVVQFLIIRNFGTGGSPSPSTTTTVTSLTLTPSWGMFNVPILFGTNAGSTIGTNGDSNIQLVIRVPVTGVQSIQVVNFALILGSEALTAYPTQTENKQTEDSTAGALPIADPNGFNFYLPTVMSPTGLIYDNSSIGEIVGLMVPSGSQTGNLLYCDGTQYFTYDYSALGIPYQRLQKVLFNSTANGPLFGTGSNFVNSYQSTGLTTEMILATNKSGSQTNPADGSTTTGFTFNTVVNTGASSIGYSSYSNIGAAVIGISSTITAVLAGIGAGTSGMFVIDLKEPLLNDYHYAFYVEAGTAASLAAGSGNPGKYFLFSSSTVNYYMWFFINGETDPAIGGRTGIRCNLDSTMSNIDVGIMIANTLSSNQTNTISVSVSPPASSYFTFNANSITYYVWYQVNGIGTVPTQPFKQLIKVALTGSETNAQIVTKTITAINSQFFAVPNLQGMFLRGNDPTQTVDLDQGIRYGIYSETINVGTFELDINLNHDHGLGNTAAATGGSAGAGGAGAITSPRGGAESRPINAAINWFIRY